MRHEKYGGAEGVRTPDPLLAKQVLFQLSYSPTSEVVVGPSGIEPETSALSARRSNQLSYGPRRMPRDLYSSDLCLIPHKSIFK
jgi:hypothetical protein